MISSIILPPSSALTLLFIPRPPPHEQIAHNPRKKQSLVRRYLFVISLFVAVSLLSSDFNEAQKHKLVSYTANDKVSCADKMMNFGGMRGRHGGAEAATEDLTDTAETIQISSLALLKMLLHARAGVPLEVMGLMIGEQIDSYTIRVADVFSMPQTATGQSVEAVDPEYQVHMLDKLKLVGRHENVVGWYHSHPGFGCWLSSDDVTTATGYENLTPRSVSVVVDPIQSVRGKVVIDAFRTISQQTLTEMMTRPPAAPFAEPRQTTSNVGFLSKSSPVALSRGLNRYYYSMPITFRKKSHELSLLMNVYKKGWQEGLKLTNVQQFKKETRESVRELISLARQAEKFISQGQDEDDLGNVGRVNAMSHLQQEAENVIQRNLNESVGAMINALVF